MYAAALELGPATADHLAKQSKIVRSTTYVQLESLMKKGLMSTYEEGKKTYFSPESPELLKRLLTKQRDDVTVRERDLVEILPDLLRKFEGAGERPVVRFFSGKEGITATREEVLTSKEKEVYTVFSVLGVPCEFKYYECSCRACLEKFLNETSTLCAECSKPIFPGMAVAAAWIDAPHPYTHNTYQCGAPGMSCGEWGEGQLKGLHEVYDFIEYGSSILLSPKQAPA